MSITSQERDISQTSQTSHSSKPRFPSQPSRPAWALAWSRGVSTASRSAPFAPLPPLSFGADNPNNIALAPSVRDVVPVWDDDEEDLEPQITTSTNPLTPASRPTDIERPSSRLSDHLTQDQQDRQAMSNDMAGRRALPAIRNDPGPPVPRSQTAKEGFSSSAVTLHGWEEGTASSTRKASTQTHIGPGYPRLEPSRVYEEMLQRETVRPPVFGGRSKNMQLGSVAESWGNPPTAETPRGMFQLDDDPPSPPPGVSMTPEEIQAEKVRRAKLGIPGEKSGRPSIKDMEKEIVDKIRRQKLTEEKLRSKIDVGQVSCRKSFGSSADRPTAQLRPDDRASIQGSGWDQSSRQTSQVGQNQRPWPSQQIGHDSPVKHNQPSRQNQGQPPLSERLREQDEYNQGGNQDDGW